MGLKLWLLSSEAVAERLGRNKAGLASESAKGESVIPALPCTGRYGILQIRLFAHGTKPVIIGTYQAHLLASRPSS